MIRVELGVVDVGREEFGKGDEWRAVVEDVAFLGFATTRGHLNRFILYCCIIVSHLLIFVDGCSCTNSRGR